MRVLGAILAGGQARRFGSDKALAILGGEALIDRVVAALQPQVEAVVICGRTHGGLEVLKDRPAPGLGPLAGLNAALHYGQANGFHAVLSVPCDAPFLPGDLRARLTLSGAAFVEDAPVVGLWPCHFAAQLDGRLADGSSRSLRGWAAAIGAAPVRLDRPIENVNTPADLERLRSSGPDRPPQALYPS